MPAAPRVVAVGILADGQATQGDTELPLSARAQPPASAAVELGKPLRLELDEKPPDVELRSVKPPGELYDRQRWQRGSVDSIGNDRSPGADVSAQRLAGVATHRLVRNNTEPPDRAVGRASRAPGSGDTPRCLAWP